MARQVLPIVGAVVGAYFGNPQLGYAIGAIIGNAVDPQHIRGPRLREGPVQNFGEGGYRSVVYGTSWIFDCQVLETGPIRRVTVEEQQGKGGGPVVETERGYQTYAIGLGEPVAAISVIRKDGKIVYDVRPSSTMLAESADFATRFRFYDGSESQLPDPDLEALPHNGVGNTAYYRGTSYMVFPNDDVTDLAGRIPTYEVEAVNSLGTADFTGLLTTRDFYDGPPDALVMGQTNVVGGFSPSGYSLGSAPLGRYFSFGTNLGYYIFKQDPDTGIYSQLAGLPSVSGAVSGTAWHPSGDYVAIRETSAATVTILERSGDTFSVHTVLSIPFTATSMAWSPDGVKFAVGTSSAFSRVYLYSFVSGVFGTPAPADCTANGGGALQLVFSPDSLFLALAGNGGFDIFDTSTSGISHFDGFTTAPTHPTGTAGIGWSSNGGYLYTLGPQVGGNRLAIYSFNAAAILGNALAFDNYPSVQPGAALAMSVTADGEFLAIADNTDSVKVYGANTLGDVLTPVADQPPPSSNGSSATDVEWTNSHGITIVIGGPVLLSALVEDICDRCGLSASQLDLSELTDEVDGVTLGGPYNGAGAITTLMPAFFFDLFEADRKIHAPKRGAAVVATITESDLVEEPDENTLRGQDIEYPRSLLLKYLDPGQNYAAPAAPVQRNSPDIRVRGEATAELPISMSRNRAFQVADKMLKVMWEDLNGEVTFSLPAGPFAWLTPTDCLGLSLRGALYRVRVEKVEASAGVLKCTARRDRQSAYTSVLTGIPLPTPTPPPPSLAGATQFVVLNIPGIIDADNPLLGVRIAACGLEGYAWTGCAVRLSADGGATWTTLTSITTKARIGTLLDPLRAASPYYTDTTNVLRVQMVDDRELESITQAQFLSEQNPAAIARADGTSELIQFRDVEDDGDNEWSLTRLHRGQLNTSAAAHSAGAKFVMLDGTVFVPLPSALMGQALQLQFVSFGTSPEVAPVFSFTWSPVHSQREFPPAHLFLERDGDDVLASAVPRHRFGTEDNPIAASDWTGYRWTATDGSNTATQETGTTAPSATFDCTGWATPITVTVAMTNRITGPGPTLSEQIA